MAFKARIRLQRPAVGHIDSGTPPGWDRIAAIPAVYVVQRA